MQNNSDMHNEMAEDRVLEVEADISNISKLKGFLLENEKIEALLRKKIYLAVEELFVNICSYGYAKNETGHVRILLRFEPKAIRLVMEDDAKAYNPLEQIQDIDEYDVDSQIGGLGKFIAFNIMDEAVYEYRDGKNILDMKKNCFF